MLRAFLTEYVEVDLVAELDLERAERDESTFVRPDDAHRISDMVWRIPRRTGSDLYVCVLIEFQRTDAAAMAIRVLLYVALLWERLARQDRALVTQRRLPYILPVVLYHGEERWRAARSIEALVGAEAYEVAAPYGARPTYYVVDVAAIDDRALRGRVDPASVLMRFERARNEEAFAEAVQGMFRMIRADEQTRFVAETMGNWVTQLAKVRKLGDQVAVERAIKQGGVRAVSMLAKNMDRWVRNRRELEEKVKRLERERVSAREQGLEQGQRDLLARLLAKKFGDEPTRAVRLASMSRSAIERATLRILEARNEPDVFEEDKE